MEREISPGWILVTVEILLAFQKHLSFDKLIGKEIIKSLHNMRPLTRVKGPRKFSRIPDNDFKDLLFFYEEQ